MDCNTPAPTPWVYSNSCSSSQWCHPTISSSVVLFSSCPRSFPASGSFQISQFFAPGGQSIGVSASALFLPMNIQGLISFRMDLLDLLAVQGTLKSLLPHHGSKASILHCSAFFIVQLSHSDMTTGKTISLTRQTFAGKLMSLLFNMLSRLLITFLPRSKRLLFSWLQSPSAVILEPPQNKVSNCFHCFPIYLPWSDGTGCHDLSFLTALVSFKVIVSKQGRNFPNKHFAVLLFKALLTTKHNRNMSLPPVLWSPALWQTLSHPLPSHLI